MTDNSEQKTPSRSENFVASIIQRILKRDTGFRAALCRADNPDTESAAWPFLAPMCDITNPRETMIFSIVAAAIAHEQPEKNGTRNIGQALASVCGADEDAKEREKRRLRRLIACDSVQELAPVLRGVLRFLQSKGASIDYAGLLDDMTFWSDRVKRRWTADFFRKDIPDEAEA